MSYQVFGATPRSNIPVTPVEYLEQAAAQPYMENYQPPGRLVPPPQRRPPSPPQSPIARRPVEGFSASSAPAPMPTDVSILQELKLIKYLALIIAILLLLLLILRR
jgi:hypothetical protein